MTDFTVTRPYTFITGAIIDPSQNNPNETTLYNGYNASMHATTGHTHSGATGDGPILQSYNNLGWFRNLAITRATTSNAGDTIKITSANGTALSATNIGFLNAPSTTGAGQTVNFSITADVSILLTGAHWGLDTKGDVTSLLRVMAINDNGTLRWGVAYLGGRTTIVTTDTSATPASITTPESVLCSVAVGSSTNVCKELGYVVATFDDTGGASENLWAISANINNCVTGNTADGQYQDCVATQTGWTANPLSAYRWTQHGLNVHLKMIASGTSNLATATLTLPVKAAGIDEGHCNITDNGVESNSPGQAVTSADSQTLTFKRTLTSTDTFTNAGTKSIAVNMWYEANI